MLLLETDSRKKIVEKKSYNTDLVLKRISVTWPCDGIWKFVFVRITEKLLLNRPKVYMCLTEQWFKTKENMICDGFTYIVNDFIWMKRCVQCLFHALPKRRGIKQKTYTFALLHPLGEAIWYFVSFGVMEVFASIT